MPTVSNLINGRKKLKQTISSTPTNQWWKNASKHSLRDPSLYQKREYEKERVSETKKVIIRLSITKLLAQLNKKSGNINTSSIKKIISMLQGI
jgi:hypothetical protein